MFYHAVSAFSSAHWSTVTAACIMPVCSVTGSADGISRHDSMHDTLPVVQVCLDTSACRPNAC